MEHWTIRRWQSEVTGTIRVDWFYQPIGGGSTEKLAFRNGGLLYSTTNPFTTESLQFGVTAGDSVDFVLGPDGDDYYDTTEFRMRIYALDLNPEAEVPEPSTLLLAAAGLGALALWRRRQAVPGSPDS